MDEEEAMPAITSTPASPGLIRQALPLPARSGEEGPAAVAEPRNTLPGLGLAKPGAPLQPGPLEASKAAANAPSNNLSKEEVASQVRELQTKIDKLNPALAFVVDEASGRALIRLTDRATKEVILQFPTEAALQISKALDQFQKGQLISRTV